MKSLFLNLGINFTPWINLTDIYLLLYFPPLRSIFENPYSTLRKYVKEGMTVVDHGCGPGFYTIPMSSLVGETGRVIAIDSDERSIGVLQSSRKRGITNVKVLVSRDLSPISTEVDFLLSKDVLCCTVLHEKLAKDIERVLKPGGVALVTIRKSRGNDPRGISAEEFFSLFTLVRDKGESRFKAWVLLEKPTG